VSLPVLDLLGSASAGTTILFGARVGGLVMIAPVFSSRTVPMMVKTSMLVLLTLLLAPAAIAQVVDAPSITPATMLSETLIGFAIGLGVAVFVGAAEAAGDLLAVQIGLSGASTLDPLTQHSVPVLGQFASLFAVTLLLAFDAHLLMLDAVASSARYIPVGSSLDLEAGLVTMVRLGSMLFALGLQFAAPVIATVLVANVALAVLSRAAPSLNVLAVAFPIQIGVGLFALAASIPLIATSFTDWPTAYDGVLTRVLGALAGGR
jgi:flagellar biosynthetic protein FliR